MALFSRKASNLSLNKAKVQSEVMLMKTRGDRARRPLERRRDWVLSILFVIAVGIGGYLLTGEVWPVLAPLIAFVSAVIQRYRRKDSKES